MNKLIKFGELLLLVFALGVLFTLFVFSKSTFVDKNQLKEGDIVFQSSQSKQCTAVQKATHSPYSHCGILLKQGDELMVFEAVQPVKFTPFNEWIKRGQGNKYEVKRLKKSDSILTKNILIKMEKEAQKYKDKNYDIYFGWNDELIYCSELVWKIYKNAVGVEVGKLKKLKEFDLTSTEVKTIMKQRYGNKIPYDETVISPSDIFESENLVPVEIK